MVGRGHGTGVPFARTACGCVSCQSCCRTQPGHLLPGQLERIAAYLGEAVQGIRHLFRSSEGMVLQEQYSGRIYRIRTIVPDYDRRAKACVFLTPEGQCRIHEVAPFGCAYFDTHMGEAEWMRRAAWGRGVVLSRQVEYDRERATLKVAEHYKPVRGVVVGQEQRRER